ncbi:MAG: sigma-70 family RNA polymerase sigma factor [Gemmatimonadota bacterium]|nr:MAG: sigma-70 family RNA polymerase sigma factor [Gemmatimonadota bacterium]
MENLLVSRGLLRRARASEPDALDALFQMFGKVVYSTAYRILLNPADADDVLQDVFLGLPQATGKYDARGSFEGWLRRVTVNTALMKLRSRRTRSQVSLEDCRPMGLATAPDQIEERLALENAIAALSEDQRIVFVLKQIEGYSHEEIGRLLSISQLASRSRYHRAIKRLREQLA